MQSPDEDPEAKNRGQFPQTRWSLIAAAKTDQSLVAETALKELCEQYWFPIYVYVRSRGHSVADAEDLTQGFFERILKRQDFATADPDKGRLRSFLLKSLKHYMADEWDKATALKRGGGCTVISIDEEAEDRYKLEPQDDVSPDKLFDKRWALTVLDNVLDQLRNTYTKSGKGELFDRLKCFLAWNSGEGSHAEAAKELGMAENAVRIAIFRMRKRYAETLRALIADTVTSDEEVTEELNYLMTVIRN